MTTARREPGSEIDGRTGLEVLDRAECLRRLASEPIGRLGVCVDGQPVVLPVNYTLDVNDVVFRSAPGTKVHAAIGRPVAFEIDGADAFRHGGWSVLVVGTAEAVVDGRERARLETLPLTRYGPGAKDVWIRIRSTAITGRRIPRP